MAVSLGKTTGRGLWLRPGSSFMSGGAVFTSDHVMTVVARGNGEWAGVCNCGWEAYGSLDVLDRWQEHAHQDHVSQVG